MKLLGISGSLRADSLNTRLLRLAAEELPGHVTFELCDGLAEIAPYDQDVEDVGEAPDAVLALRDALARADAVLFASPEYNGSVPGQLKNALDWVSRQALGAPLRGKPVAVIGTGPGQFGGVWAQADLRKVLGVMGSNVVPTELAVPKGHERLEAADEALRQQVRGLVAELALVAGEREPIAA
jgi:chromate reductase